MKPHPVPKLAEQPWLRLTRTLALILVVWVGFSFFLNPESPFLLGTFGDPDDYMRFVQVFNWLDGQSWFDLTQPRLAPDEHFVLAWSRIVDLPLAAGVALFTPILNNSREGAAYITAFLWPLLLLTAFITALVAFARPLLPRRHVWLVVALLPCFLPLMRELTPMRVDHHGWQLLLAMINLAGLHHAWLTGRKRPALIAALAAATGLAIGAEGLLFVTLSLVWLTYQVITEPRRTLRFSSLYMRALIGVALFYFVLLRPMDEWSMHSLQRLSMTQLIFTGCAAWVFLAVDYWLERRRGFSKQPLAYRFYSLSAFGLIAAGMFIAAEPIVLAGVYSEMKPENVKLILNNVIEAQRMPDLLRRMHPNLISLNAHLPLIMQNMVYPLLGFCLLLYEIRRARGQRRHLLISLLVFLAPCVALTFFWQARVTLQSHLYALPVIAYAIWQGWQRLATRYSGRKLFLREALLFFCMGPLIMPLIPQVAAKNAIIPDIAFYMGGRKPKACDMRGIARVLNDAKQFGNKPLRIVTDMSLGAELLFRTRHQVFSAPYDVSGNQWVKDLYSQLDMAAAKKMLRDKKVDLVLVCHDFSAIYWRSNDARDAEFERGVMALDKKSVPESTTLRRQLLGRLVTEEPPAFLKRIDVKDKKFLLYRVSG